MTMFFPFVRLGFKYVRQTPQTIHYCNSDILHLLLHCAVAASNRVNPQVGS